MHSRRRRLDNPGPSHLLVRQQPHALLRLHATLASGNCKTHLPAAPERIETVVGRAEVLQVFPAGKKDKAAGLLVLDGIIRKGLAARLTRDDVIVSRTNIASLRRFKDDVSEVRAGMECGAVLQDTNDIKPGDMLELFEVEERQRTL